MLSYCDIKDLIRHLLRIADMRENVGTMAATQNYQQKMAYSKLSTLLKSPSPKEEGVNLNPQIRNGFQPTQRLPNIQRLEQYINDNMKTESGTVDRFPSIEKEKVRSLANEHFLPYT
jgi:hypothetical protein